MYARRLLKILEESNKEVHIVEIERRLNIKERKVRAIIKEIRDIYQDDSFEIIPVPKDNYFLKINNQSQFKKVLYSIPHDYGNNKERRCSLLLYYLLQQNDYIPMRELSKIMEVSLATIRSDMDEISKYLDSLGLTLKRQNNKGVKIVGSEHSFRQAFNKHVIHSDDYALVTKEFFQFSKKINVENIEKYILDAFYDFGIKVSQPALRSILDQILILLYRGNKDNFIENVELGELEVSSDFYIVSQNIINFLEGKYKISIPKEETEYLASQIAGRTMVDYFDSNNKLILESLIERSLMKVDEEFLTDFSSDKILQQGLLLHLYPMMIRVSYRIELKNPLIQFVSGHYANVFLVSIRFMELIENEVDIKISEDEMGYIALHFASHLERKKQELLDSYRNILLVNELSRGNALLNKYKLSSIFPKSNIHIVSYDQLLSMNEKDDIDLVVTDFSLKNVNSKIPIINIPEVLDDSSLIELKSEVILKTEVPRIPAKNKIVLSLLKRNLFYKVSAEKYLDIIKKMALDMTKKGYANKSFYRYVLEREKRFTTVYNNGVAGPHGIHLDAVKESIGVAILDKPIKYRGKSVKLIFLINISKGNLFTYREISRFLMALTSDPNIVDTLSKSQNFEEFVYFIQKMDY